MKLNEILKHIDYLVEKHPGIDKKKSISVMYNSPDKHEYFGTRKTKNEKISYFLNANPIVGNPCHYEAEIIIHNHTYNIFTYKTLQIALNYVNVYKTPLYKALKGK